MAGPFDARRVSEVFEQLEAEAHEQLRSEGMEADAIHLARSAEMKFSLQIHRVEVAVPDGPLGDEDMADLANAFVERYEEIYGKGSGFADAGIEVGLLSVKAWGRIRIPELTAADGDGRNGAAAHGTRDVYWESHGDFCETAIHQAADLPAGASITGPAVIEMAETTVPIPPGDTATIDEYRNIVVTLA
jgi:N-methylhydantoinase A